MALHERLPDRFRPWYALLVAVFLVGAGVAFVDAGAALSVGSALYATLEGVLWAVAFQFTVGTVWSYAAEYRRAGGDWTDALFAAPVVVAVVAGVAAGWVAGGDWTRTAAVAAWAAFWAFVVAAGLLAVGVRVALGYREASP
jgi:hypothetical protein